MTIHKDETAFAEPPTAVQRPTKGQTSRAGQPALSEFMMSKVAEQYWRQQGGDRVAERAPCAPPKFSLAEIRRAIPAHCFQRSLLRSFGYLLYDLALCAVILAATLKGQQLIDSHRETLGSSVALALHSALWLVYWVVQGCVMTGLWVIGHECGHGAFADSSLISDTVGLIVHSCLLVPYFSWQISHRKHHANTNNLDGDTVFVPTRATDLGLTVSGLKTNPSDLNKSSASAAADDDDHPLRHSAPTRLFQIFVTLTVGWPAYLFVNLTGQKYPTWTNHFMPSSRLFTPNDRHLILISDAALLAVCYAIYQLCAQTSFLYMMQVYGVPYLIVNFWLVLITLLQHTDFTVPHYDGKHWDWLRGALATVDRDYGILNTVFHHITDTHVVHHLFSTMPHYNAMEATIAVKPLLGAYYRYDSRPIAQALWDAYTNCTFVAEDVVLPDKPAAAATTKGVQWFRQ